MIANYFFISDTFVCDFVISRELPKSQTTLAAESTWTRRGID
jgi:hypothetical protein